jgi:Lrp/AsnC family transcriptional regulator for asnA, asnC and gidA
MDDIDKKIIRILQTNARTPFNHISQETNVSRDTINNRFNSLCKNEIIRGTTILLNPKKTIEGTFAFIGIKTKMSDIETILAQIKRMAGICSISKAIGEYQIEGILLGKSMEEMSQTKEIIENIPEVIDVIVEMFVDTPLLCPQNFEFD